MPYRSIYLPPQPLIKSFFGLGIKWKKGDEKERKRGERKVIFLLLFLFFVWVGENEEKKKKEETGEKVIIFSFEGISFKRNNSLDVEPYWKISDTQNQEKPSLKQLPNYRGNESCLSFRICFFIEIYF